MFKVERQGDFKGPITLTLVNYPQTALVLNNNQPLTIAADKSEINGILDLKTTLATGTYTVVLRTSATVPFSRDGKTKTPSLPSGRPTPLTLTIVRRPKLESHDADYPGNKDTPGEPRQLDVAGVCTQTPELLGATLLTLDGSTALIAEAM